MSTRRQVASESQIANPLVQSSLLGEAVDGAELAILVSDEDGRCIAVNRDGTPLSVRYWPTPTPVAQMRLVLSLGRPEAMSAA